MDAVADEIHIFAVPGHSIAAAQGRIHFGRELGGVAGAQAHHQHLAVRGRGDRGCRGRCREDRSRGVVFFLRFSRAGDAQPAGDAGHAPGQTVTGMIRAVQQADGMAAALGAADDGSVPGGGRQQGQGLTGRAQDDVGIESGQGISQGSGHVGHGLRGGLLVIGRAGGEDHGSGGVALRQCGGQCAGLGQSRRAGGIEGAGAEEGLVGQAVAVAVGKRAVVQARDRRGSSQGTAHQNKGLPPEASFFHLAGQIGHRAAHDLLVRPGGAVDGRGGRIRRKTARILQFRHQIGHFARTEEKGQRGPRAGKSGGLLASRHGRAAGRAGQDDALGRFRAGQFAAQGGGSGEHAAHAGGDAHGDAPLGQPPDLFVDGTVKGGITGVQAHHALARQRGLAHDGHLFRQIHGGTVPAKAVRAAVAQQGRSHQRTGIDH